MLADHPRLILTPLVAWASDQAQQALMNQVIGASRRVPDGPLIGAGAVIGPGDQIHDNCDHSY